MLPIKRIVALLVLTAICGLTRPALAAGAPISNWPAGQAAPAEAPVAPPDATPAPAPPSAPAAVVPAEPPPTSVPAPAPPVIRAIEAVPPPPRFGAEGTMVLDGNLSAGFGHLGYSVGDSSSNTFGVEPSFDYFSSEGLSEGMSVFFRYSSGTSGIDISSRTISYGATVHLGPNFWLGERVSFWPRFELGAWQNRTTYSGIFAGTVSVDGLSHQIGSGIDLTENALYVELFAPFLFHVTPHFFVGLGPDAYTDILHTAGGASNKRRSLGASSTVGGWF